MSLEPVCCSTTPACGGRRRLLRSLLALGATIAASSVAPGAVQVAQAAALTREERDKLTPQQVLGMLLQGNDRFRRGKMLPHDYLAHKRATAAGQYPAAAIRGCSEARAPAEISLVAACRFQE